MALDVEHGVDEIDVAVPGCGRLQSTSDGVELPVDGLDDEVALPWSEGHGEGVHDPLRIVAVTEGHVADGEERERSFPQRLAASRDRSGSHRRYDRFHRPAGDERSSVAACLVVVHVSSNWRSAAASSASMASGCQFQ